MFSKICKTTALVLVSAFIIGISSGTAQASVADENLTTQILQKATPNSVGTDLLRIVLHDKQKERRHKEWNRNHRNDWHNDYRNDRHVRHVPDRHDRHVPGKYAPPPRH